jgi:Skp family chaperone for outer membrane proteins
MRRGFIPFAFAICASVSLLAPAQTKRPPDRLTPQAPASATTSARSANAAGGTGAEGKIAIINTAAFRVGIEELKAKLEALDKEFEPRNKELAGLQKQLNDLKSKVDAPNAANQPSVRNGLMEQGAEIEKTLKRKTEDYQALFQKRGQELVTPIMDKINKFLDQYGRQNNIVLVLDQEAAQNTSLVVWAAQPTDITEDFMKAYNKANSTPSAPRK